MVGHDVIAAPAPECFCWGVTSAWPLVVQGTCALLLVVVRSAAPLPANTNTALEQILLGHCALAATALTALLALVHVFVVRQPPGVETSHLSPRSSSAPRLRCTFKMLMASIYVRLFLLPPVETSPNSSASESRYC